ncbi:J domain-containing protein [Thermodesulfobacteriota bacterium]
MDIQKCFDILDLGDDATPEEAHQAYRDMVSIWHPDRYAYNERLRQKAEEKLKEINIAYKQVKSYFELKLTESIQIESPGEQSAEPEHKTTATADEPKPDKTTPFKPSTITRASSAPKRSYLHTVLILFLVSAIPVSLFIIKLLNDMQQEIKRPADTFEQTLNQELRGDTATVLKNSPPDLIPGNTPAVPLSKKPKASPDNKKTYIQIHLTNESIILTTACWEKDNMIMYKQFGGTMGVEKSRVKRIVRP